VSIGQLCNVELLNSRHLYWPDLDVDVAVESIDHPERFSIDQSSPAEAAHAADAQQACARLMRTTFARPENRGAAIEAR
jgi:hypothetical protein